MYLTPGALIPYLLQKGIASPRDLLTDAWRVTRSDGGRPILRVMNDAGRGWIIKQPATLDAAHIAMLDREAAIFQLARSVPAARALQRLLTRCRLYDAGVHALIVDQLPYDTGFDYLRRAGANASGLGATLGHSLAGIHAIRIARSASQALFGDRMPWILRIGTAPHPEGQQPSVARLVALIMQEPGLPAALKRMAHRWQPQRLIHGDAKLDNVLVRTGRSLRVYYVDWAYSGFGDPAWDVGTLLHSALSVWLLGIRIPRQPLTADAARSSSIALPGIHALMGELVRAYCRRRRASPRATALFARRALRYAGAALLQTAVAWARAEPSPTPRQLAAIQAGANLIQDPSDTLREIRQSA